MSHSPPKPSQTQDSQTEANTSNATEANTTMQDSDTTTLVDPNSSDSTTIPYSGTDPTQADTQEDEEQPPPVRMTQEARIAQKKELTLREFLGKMDDYAPIIPDALTAHYLTLAGLPPPPETPLPLARLLALATQKFIADIAADSYQYARIRNSHGASTTAGVGVPAQAGAAGGARNLGTQRPGYGGGGAGGQSAAAAAAQGVGRTVLTMEDLGMAVGEYGVNIKRGEFYR